MTIHPTPDQPHTPPGDDMPETNDIHALRAELVRVAEAHHERAMSAVAALPPKDEPAPDWLYDAWRGSSMAHLYAETLAAVLGLIGDCPPEFQGDVLSLTHMWLENGPEDENADVRPATAGAA